MLITLKAGLMVLLGVLAAVLARPRLPEDGISSRLLIYWTAITAIGFIDPTDLLTLLAMGVLMAALAPKDLDLKAPFFLLTVIAVPFHLDWVVPFPGMNYLIAITPVIVGSFCLLIPLLLAHPGATGDPRPRPVLTDVLMVFIWIVTTYLSLRGIHFSATNLARAYVVGSLTTLVPYFAISRGFRSARSFDALAKGFVTVACIFAVVGFLTAARSWNVWNHITHLDELYSTQVRYGTTRVILTLNPPLAGLILGTAILTLFHARRLAVQYAYLTWPFLLMALVALYRTYSRGGYLAFIMIAAVAFLMTIRSWGVRIGIGALGLIGAGTVFFVISVNGLDSIDDTGNFSYRAELLRLGIEQLKEFPLFGQADFALNPRFAPLIQGQGIIDFVNTYLQYGLRWGLFGLGLMVFLLVRSLWGFVFASDRFHRHREAWSADGGTQFHPAAVGIGLAATLAALMLEIFTTSDTTYHPLFITSAIALSAAYRQLSLIDPAADDSLKTKAGEIDDDTAFAPPLAPPPRQRAPKHFDYNLGDNPRLER